MEAKAASVDVGLATWWGPFEGCEGCLPFSELLSPASKIGYKTTLQLSLRQATWYCTTAPRSVRAAGYTTPTPTSCCATLH